jgi:hypothetical protein
VETITLGDVRAALDASAPGELHVLLTGKSTSRDAGKTLAPLFDRTLAAARDERRAVTLHFERLEYFNSSTIAALVQFIRAAQDRAVVLTVRYDAGQRWQALSFDALKHALRPAQAGAPAVVFASDGRGA